MSSCSNSSFKQQTKKKRSESFSTISTSRVNEILNININEIVRKQVCSISSMIEIKDSGELKKLVYQSLVEFLKTNCFFRLETKQSMVNYLMNVLINKIVKFIKTEKGIENIWIDYEFNFENYYFEFNFEEEQKYKDVMEIMVLACNKEEKVEYEKCKPIIVFENQRYVTDPIKGLKQCILALSPMFDLNDSKDPVYGILSNGHIWYLVKFSGREEIVMSNEQKFIFYEMIKDENKFINDYSELIDCLYTIIINYFKLKE